VQSKFSYFIQNAQRYLSPIVASGMGFEPLSPWSIIPAAGTGGDLLNHHIAERSLSPSGVSGIGIFSAAYKSPRAAEVARTAGINLVFDPQSASAFV
jgi:hypothetical protein